MLWVSLSLLNNKSTTALFGIWKSLFLEVGTALGNLLYSLLPFKWKRICTNMLDKQKILVLEKYIETSVMEKYKILQMVG